MSAIFDAASAHIDPFAFAVAVTLGGIAIVSGLTVAWQRWGTR